MLRQCTSQNKSVCLIIDSNNPQDLHLLEARFEGKGLHNYFRIIDIKRPPADNTFTINEEIAEHLTYTHQEIDTHWNAIDAIINQAQAKINPHQYQLTQDLEQLKNSNSRDNYNQSECNELIEHFIVRTQQDAYLNSYQSNQNQDINIYNPSAELIKTYQYTITNKEDFLKIYDIEKLKTTDVPLSVPLFMKLKQYCENNQQFILSDITDEELRGELKEAVIMHDNKGYKFEFIEIKNPMFNRTSVLTTQEQNDYNQLIQQIDQKIGQIPTKTVKIKGIDKPINRERADKISIDIKNQETLDADMHSGGLMVHARLYDRTQMVKLLTAIKSKDQALFIEAMANIISGLPDNLSGHKGTFKETFTELFVTGNFPNPGVKSMYMHFFLRCGMLY